MSFSRRLYSNACVPSAKKRRKLYFNRASQVLYSHLPSQLKYPDIIGSKTPMPPLSAFIDHSPETPENSQFTEIA